jgi:hypothetical protein
VKHLTIYRERLTNHATNQFVTLRAKVTQELTDACRKYLPLPILWAAALTRRKLQPGIGREGAERFDPIFEEPASPSARENARFLHRSNDINALGCRFVQPLLAVT